jgi:hypothetical protein
MRKPVISVIIATAVAITVSAVMPSGARAAVGRTPGGASNSGPYFVIQIINPPEESVNAQTSPYDVLDGQAIKEKQKDLDKKYKDNYDKWMDQKKIDPKAPRPMKPSIKRLKTFKTKDVADEYRKKLEDELAEKEGKKADNPAGNPVGPPRRGIR